MDRSTPKKQWNAPVVLALAALLIVAVIIFSFGFWAGVSSMQEPREHRGAIEFSEVQA